MSDRVPIREELHAENEAASAQGNKALEKRAPAQLHAALLKAVIEEAELFYCGTLRVEIGLFIENQIRLQVIVGETNIIAASGIGTTANEALINLARESLHRRAAHARKVEELEELLEMHVRDWCDEG